MIVLFLFCLRYHVLVHFPDEFDEMKVLLSEPLVVLADDPRTCSEFVSAAVDLIRPVSHRHINRQ